MLHLRDINSMQQRRLGTKQLESSFIEKHPSVLVDGKLNTAAHSHSKGSLYAPGCINRLAASRCREAIISASQSPALQYCAQYWAPQRTTLKEGARE